MNIKLQLILASAILALLAPSCQDEEFGYTQEEIFRSAYERNFEQKYGPIAPDQSWDFSTYGRTHIQNTITRAEGNAAPFDIDSEGYYHIEQGTIEWIDNKMANDKDNSSLGTSFGMLMAGEEFIAIPLWQEGSNPSTSTSWGTTTTTEYEWTLNMVVVESGKTPVVKPMWTNKSENNLQTINNTEAVCKICNGLGMKAGPGDVPCKYCNGNGYLAGTGEDCPKCGATGKIEVDCHKCNDQYLTTCSTCNGTGYTINSFLITTYIGCTKCSEPGNSWSFFRSWGIGYKRGNGLMKCDQCKGTKKYNVTCDFCEGTGTMKPCPKCETRGKGDECPPFVGLESWIDMPEPNYNSAESESKIFRAKPYDKSDWGYSEGFPKESVIYFYLDVNKKTTRNNTPTPSESKSQNSSLSKNMIVLNCPRPTNIAEGYEVMVIGCEEGDKNTKDYNDLVFLIIGKPLPEIFNYTSGKDVTSTIKKRYMIEDMGSSVDWDFNDIVVDVDHDINRKLTESGGIVSGMTTTKVTSGHIRWLCGTIPLKVQIGNKYLGYTKNNNDPWIQDPTDLKQTTLDLEGELPKDAKFPSEPVIGWSPGYDFSFTNCGYDPDLNNITLFAKQGSGNSETNGVWMVEFPRSDKTPYIIATDQIITWMDEGTDIPDTWWKYKADTSTGKK